MQSILVLGFSGVPYKTEVDESSYDTDDSSHDTDAEFPDEEDEETEGTDTEEEGAETDHRSDLFEEGVYYTMMMQVLQGFVGDEFPKMEDIQATILRHRRKLLETLEDVSVMIPCFLHRKAI